MEAQQICIFHTVLAFVSGVARCEQIWWRVTFQISSGTQLLQTCCSSCFFGHKVHADLLKWYLINCILALFHPWSKPPSKPALLQMELNGLRSLLEQPPGNTSNLICRQKCSWKWSKDFIKIWVNCDLGEFLTQHVLSSVMVFLPGPDFICGVRYQLCAHHVRRPLERTVRSWSVITKWQPWIPQLYYSSF